MAPPDFFEECDARHPGRRERERAELEQDLQSMGCARFLNRPWALKSKELVHEFIGICEGRMERKNIFDNTIQDRPEEWTTETWRAVYCFLSNGAGLAN